MSSSIFCFEIYFSRTCNRNSCPKWQDIRTPVLFVHSILCGFFIVVFVILALGESLAHGCLAMVRTVSFIELYIVFTQIFVTISFAVLISIYLYIYIYIFLVSTARNFICLTKLKNLHNTYRFVYLCCLAQLHYILRFLCMVFQVNCFNTSQPLQVGSRRAEVIYNR